MKFIMTAAVMLAAGGSLNAIQLLGLGGGETSKPAQASTYTIVIEPTTEWEKAAKTPETASPGAKAAKPAEAGKASAAPSGAVKETAKPAAAAPAAALKPAGTASAPAPAPAEGINPPAPAAKPAADSGFVVGKKHVVAKGDTLWDLSRKYYKDPFKWGKIYNANSSLVRNPDLILPAAELAIPDVTEEIKPEPAPPAPAAEPAAGDVMTEVTRADEVAAPAAPAVPAVPAAPPAPGAGLLKGAKSAPLEKPGEQLPDFELADLSDDLPQDLKEWRDNVKVIPDNWKESGVITAKESVDGSDYSLAVNGEIVVIKAASAVPLKPGDILTSYMKGGTAFDKKGVRVGRELQKTGMLEVLSVEGDKVKAKVLDASTTINKGQVVKK